MKPIYTVIFAFALPLVAGYGIRQALDAAGRSAEPLLTLSRYQKLAANLVFAPLMTALSLWSLNLGQVQIIALPIIGAVYYVLALALSWLYARSKHMNGQQSAAFTFSGMCSNTGLLGGLFCYLFFGEAGYALNNFLRLAESPLIFLVGFPVASALGKADRVTLRDAARQVARDPSVMLPVLSIFAGILLNLSGVVRPAALGTLNAILIPLSTANFAFAIGPTLRLGSFAEHLRPCGAMVILKFTLLPATVAALGWMAGLHTVDGGLPLKVAVLTTCMPVGFLAPAVATTFNLDEGLANAVWFTTTMLVFPLVLLLKPILG